MSSSSPRLPFLSRTQRRSPLLRTGLESEPHPCRASSPRVRLGLGPARLGRLKTAATVFRSPTKPSPFFFRIYRAPASRARASAAAVDLPRCRLPVAQKLAGASRVGEYPGRAISARLLTVFRPHGRAERSSSPSRSAPPPPPRFARRRPPKRVPRASLFLPVQPACGTGPWSAVSANSGLAAAARRRGRCRAPPSRGRSRRQPSVAARIRPHPVDTGQPRRSALLLHLSPCVFRKVRCHPQQFKSVSKRGPVFV